ncbi:MAG: S8 family serine peptidase [Humibacillus sp.]|nr:S8 family serine peptidase [Humibacillus sp.]MDN5777417.1 S8 family serine peptidase [Humibacillus sp.]
MSQPPDAPEGGPPTDPGVPSQDWWSAGLPNDTHRGRLRSQFAKIKDGLEGSELNRSRRAQVGVHPNTGDLADGEFLYRMDTLVTTDANAGRVREALGLPAARGKNQRDVADQPDGLTVVRLRKGQDGVAAARLVEAALGPWIAAPDLVHHVTTSSACPATEPELPGGKTVGMGGSGQSVPKVNGRASAGAGVKVAVIDTGFRESVLKEHTPSWLQGVTGEEEDPTLVGHYRGHGTFVAGVVRAMAPKSQVHVHRLLTTGGAEFESDLIPRMVAALRTGPDIISMSAGVNLKDTTREGHQWTSIGLRVFNEVHLQPTRTLFVCAAGNDGGPGPFEPASQGWPVAVGALDASGVLAGYSNRGPWVDVYARGSDVVNAYPDGVYHYEESSRPDVTFDSGLARWSGTSFATPLVAGLVAARMSWSGETPRAAWLSLYGLAKARAADGGLPTLRPGDGNP